MAMAVVENGDITEYPHNTDRKSPQADWHEDSDSARIAIEGGSPRHERRHGAVADADTSALSHPHPSTFNL